MTSGHVVLANGIAQDSHSGQKMAAVVSLKKLYDICMCFVKIITNYRYTVD